MAKEKVIIKATGEVKQLAAKAVNIQDACNGLAVANFLIHVIHHFQDGRRHGQDNSGSSIGMQNPVTQAVINKLNHLAELEQSREMCFSACMDLAEGKDVEWEVDFQ